MKNLIDQGIFFKLGVGYEPKAKKRKMSTDEDTKKIRENNIRKSCDDDDDDPDWSMDDKITKVKKIKTSKVNNTKNKIDENLVEIYKHVSIQNCGFTYHLNSKKLTSEDEKGIAFLKAVPGLSLQFLVETGMMCCM